MKKLLPFVFVIAFSFFSTNSNATHIMGGEITYTCLGSNVYEIQLNLYRDCYGITAPSFAAININSTCLTANLQVPEDSGSGSIISCDNVLSACNGGNLPGVMRHSYTTQFTLLPCADYVISYSACCRNNAISNIANPSGTSFEISTTLDNSNSICNTSPVFNNLPIPYICVNDSFTYDHGAFEPDGDSLVYYLTSAIDQNGIPVTYTPGFSPTNPISTTSGVNLDASTGMLSFNPNLIGSYVVTVKVDEFRNGQLIGTIARDMQFIITNTVCNSGVSTAPPSVDSAFLNLSGANLIDSSTLLFCGNSNSYNFDVVVSDIDAMDTIYAIIIGGQGTISQTGSNPVTFNVSGIFNLFNSSVSLYFHNGGCDGTILNYNLVSGGNFGFSIDAQNPACNGSNGSLSVVLDSIWNPSNFTYVWSNGATTQSISGLSEGSYSVTVTDVCSVTDSIQLFDSCGAVSGSVYEDLNGNGTQDSGENAIAGVAVSITGAGYTISSVTDANGNYSILASDFTNYIVTINPPNYLVSCSTPMGGNWIPGTVTAPVAGSYTVSISLGNPVSSGNTFGVQPPPPQCGTISGIVFDDTNGNGVQDVNEVGYAGAIITASTGQTTVSGQNGNYSISVPLNLAVTVEVSQGSNFYYCGASTPSYVQTFPANNGNYTVTLTTTTLISSGNDFGLQQNAANYDVGVAFIWTTQSLSAGDDFAMWMDYKSFGTTTTNCTLRLDFDPLLTYVSSAITPDNQGSTWVEWVYPPGTTPSWYCMNIIFNLDSSAVAGNQIDFTGSWDCGGVDACPGNDSLTQSFTIQFGPLKTGSYESVAMFSTDRNGMKPYLLSEEDNTLSYVISFQNTTGNDVYCFLIENPISDHLDISTISYPFASMPFNMTISDDNTLYFEFDNIYLADSATDKLNSYGFIQYNIRLKDDLTDGTIIENRARFAWNTYNPDWTNTVEHKFEKTTGLNDVDANAINIYPNPSNGSNVRIESNNSVIQNIKVYNILGSLIMDQASNLNSEVITIKESGSYLLEIKTSTGTVSKRIVIF
ncbi:MAG: T9SS type A sorting domain-containing protein [Chitinophagales bacterium]|nr:T9SS type A sorting domain-containing protein [Chitinophagales bacterium]